MLNNAEELQVAQEEQKQATQKEQVEQMPRSARKSRLIFLGGLYMFFVLLATIISVNTSLDEELLYMGTKEIILEYLIAVSAGTLAIIVGYLILKAILGALITVVALVGRTFVCYLAHEKASEEYPLDTIIAISQLIAKPITFIGVSVAFFMLIG